MHSRHSFTVIAALVASLAGPAAADPAAYTIEARVVNGGEVVGTPVLSAVAHEPASVTVPISQNRTLTFWAVVKPLKRRPDCHKVMVRVILKGRAERYVWENELHEMCGDETKTFGQGTVTTVRVQPPSAAAAAR